MRARTLNYVQKIDSDIEQYEQIDNLTVEKLNTDIERHLVQISFFQHERLIHLIVTFLFALIAFGCALFTIASFNIAILLLTVIALVVLGFYIRHYYLLENKVQYMYKQYDKLLRIKDAL